MGLQMSAAAAQAACFSYGQEAAAWQSEMSSGGCGHGLLGTARAAFGRRHLRQRRPRPWLRELGRAVAAAGPAEREVLSHKQGLVGGRQRALPLQWAESNM